MALIQNDAIDGIMDSIYGKLRQFYSRTEAHGNKWAQDRSKLAIFKIPAGNVLKIFGLVGYESIPENTKSELDSLLLTNLVGGIGAMCYGGFYAAMNITSLFAGVTGGNLLSGAGAAVAITALCTSVLAQQLTLLSAHPIGSIVRASLYGATELLFTPSNLARGAFHSIRALVGKAPLPVPQPPQTPTSAPVLKRVYKVSLSSTQPPDENDAVSAVEQVFDLLPEANKEAFTESLRKKFGFGTQDPANTTELSPENMASTQSIHVGGAMKLRKPQKRP